MANSTAVILGGLLDPKFTNITAAKVDGWYKRVNGPLICTELRRQSRGFWFGDSLTQESLSTFMLQLIMMNVISEGLSFIFRPLKQPKVVCHFLAGLIISPNVMGRVKIFRGLLLRPEEFALFGTIGFLGILYFLFLLAVKTDLGVLRRSFRKAPLIGFATLFCTYFSSLITLSLIKLPGVRKGVFPVLFSMGFSVVRFANVAMTFNELNLMTSELGQLVLSCALTSEVMGVAWTLLGLYLRFPANYGLNAMYSATVMALLYFVLRPGVWYIIQRSRGGKSVTENFISLILVSALMILFVGDLVGLIQMGVLIFGLMIPSGPPVGATLSEKAETFISELLFPIYYIIIGYSLDLSNLKLQASAKILVVVVIVVLSKLASASSSAYYLSNTRFRDSLVLGMMMLMKGPFDLFTYNRWSFFKDIDQQVYTVLALADVVVTAIVTPLIDRLYNPHARLSAAGKIARFFINTPRNMELRVMCCVHAEDDVPGVITLLNALAPSSNSPVHAYVLHLSELIGQSIPEIVPYDRSMRWAKSNAASPIMRAFQNYARNSTDVVNIRPYSVTAAISNMHEYICRLALQEQIPLILLPFRAHHGVDVTESTAIRSINNNVQTYSPCTVGLLVTRGIDRNSQPTDSLVDVVVLFITGNDDREALAMGIRMIGNPNVRVTLIRIDVNGWDCESIEEKAEKKLDDLLVDQFITEKEMKEQVRYHEMTVENLDQVMQSMKGLEIGYNLIVVGRQRRKTKLMDEEMMLDWSDNPELGVLGDMVTSSDYLSSVSVLVMQHYGDVNHNLRNELKEDEGQHLLIKTT